MKKSLIYIVAAVTAILSLSSCETILNSIANTPLFFVPDTMYDGQTFQITRLSACKYEWSVNSPVISIELTKKGNDENIAIATARLTEQKDTKVTITAVNPDKADEAPVTHDVIVSPWTIGVYDTSGNTVNPASLKANTKYLIKFVSGRNPVDKIMRNNVLDKDNINYHELKWSADKTFASITVPVLENGATDYTTTRTFSSSKTGDVTISAQLVDKTNSITVTVK